jgi:hypothetical protein
MRCFLLEACEHELDVGTARGHAGESDVLPRMMILVRVLSQVRDDIEHQLVVRPALGVKHLDFLVQEGGEPVEIGVLRVPRCDRIGHCNPLKDSYKAGQTCPPLPVALRANAQ